MAISGLLLFGGILGAAIGVGTAMATVPKEDNGSN